MYSSCLCCHSFLWQYVVFLSGSRSVQLSCRLLILPLEIQLSREVGWDHINQFNPASLVYLSQARIWIYDVICCGLVCVHWVQLRWEVIVCFVDIGGIVDHHHLSFLFITLTKTNVFFIVSRFQLKWISFKWVYILYIGHVDMLFTSSTY